MCMVMTSETHSFDFEFDNKPSNKPMVIVPFSSKQHEWRSIEGFDIHNKDSTPMPWTAAPIVKSKNLRLVGNQHYITGPDHRGRWGPDGGLSFRSILDSKRSHGPVQWEVRNEEPTDRAVQRRGNCHL